LTRDIYGIPLLYTGLAKCTTIPIIKAEYFIDSGISYERGDVNLSVSLSTWISIIGYWLALRL